MEPTLIQKVESVVTDFEKVKEQLQKDSAKMLADIAATGDASKEVKAAVDKSLSEFNGFSQRLKDIELAVAKIGTGRPGDEPRKTIGQEFVESDDWKAFREKGSVRGTFVRKVKQVITSLTTDADGSAGDLIVRDRVAQIYGLPERKLVMRDLLTVGRTGSNLIEYVKETGFTNAAAMQTAEGASKAESTIKFDVFSAPVRTLAHFVRASKQVLDDAAQLQTYIDKKLLYGLKYVEDDQILNATGSGVNLDGIIHQASAFSAPFVPSFHNNIDAIRLAILQVALAHYPADGVVLHPTSWAGMELTKDENGRYIFGNPQGSASQTLWRLPVVDTMAMAATKFLVGAFKLGATLWDREDANVQASTEDADNFTKNLVTIRAEERLALTVERPEAFVYGDFGDDS